MLFTRLPPLAVDLRLLLLLRLLVDLLFRDILYNYKYSRSIVVWQLNQLRSDMIISLGLPEGTENPLLGKLGSNLLLTLAAKSLGDQNASL